MSHDDPKKVAGRKPQWLKIKLHNTQGYAEVASLVKQHDLHTICSSGRCPNISECWSRGTATFMILGDICTRKCRFCATATGKPLPVDHNEPLKIARSIRVMGLRYAVITSVDRDDLPDGGSAHWVETINAIRSETPSVKIEVLIPDFDGRRELLDQIIATSVDVIGHNLETVEELTPAVRSRARYKTSLEVLRYISEKGKEAKSGIMVGLGESSEQVVRTLSDLAQAGVRRATIGQYLQPTPEHYPVAEYVHPDLFAYYKQEALKLGFTHIESSPLVRSSYMAEEQNESCSL